MDSSGNASISSSNHEENNLLPAHLQFGVPSCSSFANVPADVLKKLNQRDDWSFLPFPETEQYLSDYHKCLSSGCAVNMDRASLFEIIRHVMYRSRPISFPIDAKYIQMIYEGQIRPDNYMTILDQIAQTYLFPFSFLPFSPPPFNPFNNFALPPPLAIPDIPALPTIDDDLCPFSNLPQYQSLPSLSGRITGCCDRPRCFLPKSDLRDPTSGVASYLYPWSIWGKCNQEGGVGIQNRTRVCIGNTCSPDDVLIQFQECNGKHSCKAFWSAWGECSVTCGGGTRVRSRKYPGVGECGGPPTESKDCKTGECPTLEYGDWSSCSSTCGFGTQTRTIRCLSPGAYNCPDVTKETKDCEVYCGVSSIQCNATSCVYEQNCLKQDGNPGHCENSNDPLIGEPCLEDVCLDRDERRQG